MDRPPVASPARSMLITWAGAAVVALVVALVVVSTDGGRSQAPPQSEAVEPPRGRVQAGTDWLNVKAYGAKGDGRTDDSKPIQSAIDDARGAAPEAGDAPGAHGGTVYFPRGHYLVSRPLNLDNAVSVVLRGDGAQAQGFGTLPASAITYSGSGSGSFLLARSSNGLAIKGLGIRYSSARFTGNLVDFSHAPGQAGDAAYMTLEDCLLSGVDEASAAALVSFHQAILGSVRNCHLQFAKVGITGKRQIGATASYANAIEIRGSTFDDLTTAAITNAGEGWSIDGNWFEGTDGGTGGMPHAYSDDLPGGRLASGTAGLSFTGNWFGDAVRVDDAWIATGEGTVVRGLHVAGNMFSGGQAALRVPGIAYGISINGNFMGTKGPAVDLEDTFKDGVSIVGNQTAPNLPPVVGTKNAKHATISANSNG
jgi:hypothetical protein